MLSENGGVDFGANRIGGLYYMDGIVLFTKNEQNLKASQMPCITVSSGTSTFNQFNSHKAKMYKDSSKSLATFILSCAR